MKYIYPESWLSEAAGVSRAVLKKYRVKGEYRQNKSKGRPYQWSREGVERVWKALGIKEAIPALDVSSSAANGWNEIRSGQRAGKCDAEVQHIFIGDPIVDDVPKLVTVSKLVPNKRILFAQNGSEVLQVIVPSSEVWTIGDPLRVKASERHRGYYELVGKAPRWRGDRIYRHEFV